MSYNILEGKKNAISKFLHMVYKIAKKIYITVQIDDKKNCSIVR